MSFKMCPQCFAELYQQSVCSFCGYQMDQIKEPSVVSTSPAVSFSKFEMTGLPFQVTDFMQVPKGTLFISRYSVLQFKQTIEEGACYIAYDHWLGQHTFLTLWQNSTVVSEYHRDIQLISTVYDAGEEPVYSSFIPQEGLPLQQALMKLGWTSGRIWEVFRQVCQVTITAEDRGGRLPLFPPKNLWVRPDGVVEMSLQPDGDSDFSGAHIPQLIALLGWLYNPESELNITQFPLKLRPVLFQHWDHPTRVEHFWHDIDERIRGWGWYKLSSSVQNRLQNEHYPNVVCLFDEQINIPNSIQLCVWNAVSGTWRLKEGKLLLRSSLEALFEAGVLDGSQNRPNLNLLQRLVMGATEPCPSDLESVLLHLRYGDRSQARIFLAAHIRQNSNFEIWVDIAEAFFAIGETHSAMEIVFIAASRISFVRQALQLASVVCWNTSDYRWIKRLLTVSLPKEATIWELTDFTEGWVALLGAYPSATVLKRIETAYNTEGRELQKDWEAHCIDRFGALVGDLFSWNPILLSR